MVEQRQTLGGICVWAGQVLAAAGFEDARREARYLIEAVLDIAPGSSIVQAELVLSEPQQRLVQQAVARRANQEPVGRIAGWREFWTLRLALNQDTLEPRPDSETLVQAVLERASPSHQSGGILDLGCGTGCLGLALLSEWPEARLLAVDRAFGACQMTWHNAVVHNLVDRVRVMCGDWGTAVGQKFDVIVSNPPYIGLREQDDLAAHVRRYDPARALYAGDDGLDAYRVLVPVLKELLNPGGICAIEIGAQQQDDVSLLARQAGWGAITPYLDIQGHVRTLVLQ